MNDLAGFTERLRDGLSNVLASPEVSAERTDFYRIIARVVSLSFEDMDEATRQQTVWHVIFDCFDEEQQREIEFVYTDAPSEMELTSNASEGSSTDRTEGT